MKKVLTPQILQPAGRPTDTFSRPAAGAKLGQLAESLSRFAPALQRFAVERQEGIDQKDQIEGENKAREFTEAGKTYKQAIDAGLIEKHHSPFFRLGAYETFGRSSAYRFATDFDVALAQSNVAESTNPADFEKFEQEFRAKWSAEHLGDKVDPFMSRAFGKQADALMEEQRHNFAAQAGARLVRQTGEAFHAEAFAIIEDAHTKGLTPEQYVSQLTLAADRQVAAGMNRSVVNQLLSSAIDAAAKSVNDAGVLKVKHEIKLGSGTLAGTTYGSKGAEEAEAEIAGVNQRKLAADRENEKYEHQKTVDAITGEAVAAVQGASHPLNVDMKPFIDRLVAAGEGDKATTLLQMRDAFADREYQDDPTVMKRLVVGIHEGNTTMRSLDNAIASKAITASTYLRLKNEIDERDKAGGSGSKLSAKISDIRSRVRAMYPVEFGDNSGARLRAENAQAEAGYNYILWKQTPEGQKATAAQEEEWIHNQVVSQFKDKADEDTSSDALTDVPPAKFRTGPQPVNPAKAPAAPAGTIALIRSEYEKFKRGGKMSRESLAALKRLGVAPDKIEEFLAQQRKYTNP